jgi:hypothetical protein
MQARSEPSTAPHFIRGDKVTALTKNLFLRGQPNMKLRDLELGRFTVEEQIKKHIYKLNLPPRVPLHPVFRVKNFRPCFTTSFRHVVPVNIAWREDEEFDVSNTFVVCKKS